MKQLLVIIALLATILVSAQTIISPSTTGEYCPNQEYTFTVTALPGRYSGIDVSGGAYVTVQPTATDTTGKNITFKGTFGDVAGAQSFIITAGSIPKTFPFTKVKTLVRSYSNDKDNISTLTIPI